jgi:hypothetical protein
VISPHQTQSRSTSNENDYTLAVRPTEVLIPSEIKGKDPTGLLGGFEKMAAHFYKDMQVMRLSGDLVKAEHTALETLQEVKHEKFNGEEYVGILSRFSNTLGQPSKYTVWAKCMLMSKYIQDAATSGKTVDASFLICANLDLGAEIQASGLLDTENKNNMRNDDMLSYISSNVSSTVELYHFAFNSRKIPAEKRYFVEKALCTVHEAYSSSTTLASEAGVKSSERTRDMNVSRREKLENLISGIRGEAEVWMRLEPVLFELSGIEDLNDKTIEMTYGKDNIPVLRELAANLRNACGEGDYDLSIQHTSGRVDSRGIGDLEVIAKTKSGNKSLLIIEVKTYNPDDIGKGLEFAGVYPKLQEKVVYMAKTGAEVKPPTPYPAERYVEDEGKAVMSVRIPTRWTSQRESTVPSKLDKIDIGKGPTEISMMDLGEALKLMHANNAKKTNAALFATLNTLISHQNVVNELYYNE